MRGKGKEMTMVLGRVSMQNIKKKLDFFVVQEGKEKKSRWSNMKSTFFTPIGSQTNRKKPAGRRLSPHKSLDVSGLDIPRAYQDPSVSYLDPCPSYHDPPTTYHDLTPSYHRQNTSYQELSQYDDPCPTYHRNSYSPWRDSHEARLLHRHNLSPRCQPTSMAAYSHSSPDLSNTYMSLDHPSTPSWACRSYEGAGDRY